MTRALEFLAHPLHFAPAAKAALRPVARHIRMLLAEHDKALTASGNAALQRRHRDALHDLYTAGREP